MNDIQGELPTTITHILVRMVVLAVKYVIFINVYTTSLLKSFLYLPLRYLWANDYKGKGISWRDNHILFKSDVRHCIHFLVFTDTDLYCLTKGKAYLANQRWRRPTCLQDQCDDVSCYLCMRQLMRFLYLSHMTEELHCSREVQIREPIVSLNGCA